MDGWIDGLMNGWMDVLRLGSCLNCVHGMKKRLQAKEGWGGEGGKKCGWGD